MKTTASTKRKKITPAVPLPLKVSAIGLTQTEADTLTKLEQEQSDLIGRVISRSAVVRALLRLVDRKIEPLELRDEIEIELSSGRRWGHDAVKPMP